MRMLKLLAALGAAVFLLAGCGGGKPAGETQMDKAAESMQNAADKAGEAAQAA
ncbi:MAG: hypothetical protein IT485_05440, partial [Gammaproteobacteria bacterium]|nr:hypothetical protein [Gammaproteobacteria bacterium]